MKQHKWHKEIKVWADGAEIEVRFADRTKYCDDWSLMLAEVWNEGMYEYRIKPQPKEPQYLKVFKVNNNNFKFVEDGGYIEHNSDYIEYLGKIKLEVDDE